MSEIDDFDDVGGAESEYELFMPFLPVQSKGGPLDDLAYTAGWEMGRLDVILATAKVLHLVPDTKYMIHAVNAEQVDLLAMRHGFVSTIEPLNDDYCGVLFEKIIPEEDNDGI